MEKGEERRAVPIVLRKVSFDSGSSASTLT